MKEKAITKLARHQCGGTRNLPAISVAGDENTKKSQTVSFLALLSEKRKLFSALSAPLWCVLVFAFFLCPASAQIEGDVDSNGALDTSYGGTNRTSLSADVQAALAAATDAALRTEIGAASVSVLVSQVDCSTIGTLQICVDSGTGKIYYYDDNLASYALIGALDFATLASPTTSGTWTHTGNAALSTEQLIRPATTTADHWIGIGSHNGTAFGAALKAINKGDGTRELALQSGTSFTGVGKRFFSVGADVMSDDDWNGDAYEGINCGENIAQWDLVYLSDTDSEWMIADADAAGKWPARGIATAACTNGNAGVILFRGAVRNDGWAWTAKHVTLYLDDDTAGAIVELAAAPATSGDCIQIVGFALSDDEAFFDFNGVYGLVK